MSWQDEVANAFAFKPAVTQPAQANRAVVDFFIGGLLLLIALGGLAM